MNYVYIRFSTDKQDERQQMNTIENYLNQKNITIDRVETDEGVSGGVTYKKRNLYKLVSSMKAGDCLIVTEISRLGRSMSDLNKLVNDELKPRGVRLIVIAMGLDLDCKNIKALDEMILFAFSFAAQIEKEMIQQRTKAGLEARIKSGQRVGGTKELWGSKTGADRSVAITKMVTAAAQQKKERARNNVNNKKFWDALELWEAKFGNVIAYGQNHTDFDKMAQWFNNRGCYTSKGMPFNAMRIQAMYRRVVKLYPDRKFNNL